MNGSVHTSLSFKTIAWHFKGSGESERLFEVSLSQSLYLLQFCLQHHIELWKLKEYLYFFFKGWGRGSSGKEPASISFPVTD
jgi:hypothetical protein